MWGPNENTGQNHQKPGRNVKHLGSFRRKVGDFRSGGKERKYAAALKERGGSADKRGEEDAAWGMRKAPPSVRRGDGSQACDGRRRRRGRKTHTAAKGSVNILPLLPEAEIGEGNGEKESSLQLLPFSFSLPSKSEYKKALDCERLEGKKKEKSGSIVGKKSTRAFLGNGIKSSFGEHTMPVALHKKLDSRTKKGEFVGGERRGRFLHSPNSAGKRRKRRLTSTFMGGTITYGGGGGGREPSQEEFGKHPKRANCRMTPKGI